CAEAAFPEIEAPHAGKHVHAGREVLLDHGLRDRLGALRRSVAQHETEVGDGRGAARAHHGNAFCAARTHSSALRPTYSSTPCLRCRAGPSASRSAFVLTASFSSSRQLATWHLSFEMSGA